MQIILDLRFAVERCKGNMRELVKLCDLLENFYDWVDVREFDMISDYFHNLIKEVYGQECYDDFLDVCNSNRYFAYLEEV